MLHLLVTGAARDSRPAHTLPILVVTDATHGSSHVTVTVLTTEHAARQQVVCAGNACLTVV